MFPDTILKNNKAGESFPEDYLDTYRGAGFLMGTIGLDVFKNRILILDLKNDKIGYADTLSKNFYTENERSSTFLFYKNRIIIPVQIGKEYYKFMYDCGASQFTLQTTPKNSALFTPKIYTDTLFGVNNGEAGTVENVLGGRINKPVRILNKEYEDMVVYVEKVNQKFLMKLR